MVLVLQICCSRGRELNCADSWKSAHARLAAGNAASANLSWPTRSAHPHRDRDQPGYIQDCSHVVAEPSDRLHGCGDSCVPPNVPSSPLSARPPSINYRCGGVLSIGRYVLPVILQMAVACTVVRPMRAACREDQSESPLQNPCQRDLRHPRSPDRLS